MEFLLGIILGGVATYAVYLFGRRAGARSFWGDRL
jgi:hypothetical protein